LPTAASDPEAELQKELQAMFEVDSQEHLQTYFQLAQQLNAASWVADIQTIYRAIHTIKGSAVTVGADAVLHAAMVLEDLLSDLRYLEIAPPLEDGQLHRMLLEAGELLGSCLQFSSTEADTRSAIEPTVNRIKTLHESIQLQYIPNWDELTQVHQEFAEQGFDLVILELEMAINQLPEQDIPHPTVTTAAQVLAQLQQIGQDLQLAEDWSTLLDRATQLQHIPVANVWRQQWPVYFDLLKHCAKQSGQLTPAQQDRLTALSSTLSSLDLNPLPESLTLAEPLASPTKEEPSGGLDVALVPELNAELDVDLDFSFDDLPLDLDLASMASVIPEESAIDTANSVGHQIANLGTTEPDEFADFDDAFLEAADQMDFDGLLALNLDEPEVAEQKTLSLELDQMIDPKQTLPGLFPALEQTVEPRSSSTSETVAETFGERKRDIKIPVPLERLDQSSQRVVETLLTARSAFNETSTLQTQLAQLTVLTQESVQYISRLRQLQDDYALLRDLSDQQESTSGVSLERYRQGYTTINRLLENILRMSELGAELEGISQQTVGSLRQLNHNISQLKDGIETSRLIPFRNLTLRARAILRDLTNRYGKPVHLEIKGEQIELDAGVIQQLEPVLLHLLRNAYDHGIETTDERLNQGKPVQATIAIALERRGNLYRLFLRDDGRGIDGQKIGQLAQKRGFALTQTQTAADLLTVLCQPGFSSRSTVSEVSGRGVGMDVVAEKIASIGGHLHLETQWGQGTTFIIEIPAPQLLVSCVLLQVGEHTVALPTDDILETMMAGAMQIQSPATDQQHWQITTERGTAPGYALATFWQQSLTELAETAICIRTRTSVFESSAEVWLLADDLLGQEELLIQSLPHPLVSPAGLLGVSLQPDGRLLSVLDPVTLADSFATGKPVVIPSQEEGDSIPRVDATQTILVVDDAALMRRRLESSLNTYGYMTFTCSDGQEAWQWLQVNGTPDLMITDVEMPHMDGFTLIDRCRQSDMNMPILVVSSRLSEEWGKEAERLGANDYLNKGFSTPDLLNRVKACLEE
jgi:chemotaxis protein histidine kinase CheA